MKSARLGICTSLALLVGNGLLLAKDRTPSYSREVQPFLTKYCLECHNSKKMKAGLNVESYQDLMEGSDRGPVLVAGKPGASSIVLRVEHKREPFMPPEKSRQPKAAEVGLLRAW